MVAETQQEMMGKPAKKGKRGGKRPNCHAPYDVRIRLRLRTLYLVHGLSPAAIAAMVGEGWTASRVSGMALREGWSAMRKQNALLATKEADARIEEGQRELLAAVAAEAEELTMGALSMTREGLDRRDAKLAVSGSATARNLAAVAMSIRKPAQQQQSTTNLSLYVLRMEPAKPSIKQADQVLDLPPATAQQ